MGILGGTKKEFCLQESAASVVVSGNGGVLGGRRKEDGETARFCGKGMYAGLPSWRQGACSTVCRLSGMDEPGMASVSVCVRR